MHKAELYSYHDGRVRCDLCHHSCVLRDGQRGICRVRINRGGELYSMVYGQVVAENIDPVEKKPLFHLLPGTRTYSLSTRGCNFRCQHCQNSSISQVGKDDDPSDYCKERSVEDIVEGAVRSGCRTISYTYVEPTVFYEFALDCAERALTEGVRNIFVSNGYMSEAAIRRLAPLTFGINIDCKAFSDDFYKKVCGARLQPVLDSISLYAQLGVWVEVTTLLIPGLNDSESELRDLSRFLVSISPDIPWHVTAFHPSYKLTNIPSTPLSTLDLARDIGLEAGLRYVYAGNIPGSGRENTLCHACGTSLIERHGFVIQANNLEDGRCGHCAVDIAGRWK